MRITEHIERLLFTSDCVIVPEFGAFVTSYVPASFDRKRSMMLPPRREIIFNRRLTHNDGLLTNFVAQGEHISYAEAQKRIGLFVQSTKQQIAQGNAVMLAGLGVMRKVNGDTVFTSQSRSNFLPSSYGLAPLSVEKLSVPMSITMPSFDTVRRFAVTAAAVAALLFATPTLRDGQVSEEYSRASLADAFQPKAVPTAVEEPVATTEEAEEAKNYHIIVASFTNRRDANDYIDRQRSRGIDGLTCIQGKGRVRVAVASFAGEDEARAQNAACRKIAGFEKAWVLCTE